MTADATPQTTTAATTVVPVDRLPETGGHMAVTVLPWAVVFAVLGLMILPRRKRVRS